MMLLEQLGLQPLACHTHHHHSLTWLAASRVLLLRFWFCLVVAVDETAWAELVFVGYTTDECRKVEVASHSAPCHWQARLDLCLVLLPSILLLLLLHRWRVCVLY